VLALSGEELGPGNYFRVLLQQGAPLAFGHSAPDTEFHPVVQRVGAALGHHGTVPTNHGGFPLSGTPDEEFVRIGGATASFGDPGDAGFGRGAVNGAVN
jgi:hypothetical protein